MIAADDGVPHAILRRLLAVEIRTRGDVDDVGPIDREPLETEEVMQLVPNDRSPHRAAPALVLRVRLRQALLLREEVLLGHLAALEVAEPGPADLVRARLRDRIDDGPRGPAELRVVLVRQHLEFLDRLDRRPRLRARALPDDVVVVVAAVEHVVVVAWILPVDRDRVAAERLRADRRHDSRQQADEPDEVAVHARQLDQRLLRDVAADFLRRHVDERRVGVDGDRLFERADLHRDLDARRLADLEPQILAVEFLEPLQLGDGFVHAGHEPACHERPVGAADGFAEHAGLLIANRDGDPRQHRSLRVHDAAAQFGRALLRRGGRREEQGEQHPE